MRERFKRGLMAIGLGLGTSALFMLAFVNCAGQNEVHTTGEMTQNAVIGLSPDLPNQVKDIFQTVFGRAPTTAELSAYVSQLQAGTITLAQLEAQLQAQAQAAGQTQPAQQHISFSSLQVE